MTNKRSNAPQWLRLRDEVLASVGVLISPVSDRKTINVMENVTRMLMAKQALSDRMKAAFIENIRRRTKHTDFSYDGEIKLTANQWKHAKKTGRDKLPETIKNEPVSSDFHPSDDRDELLAAFQLLFTHLSPELHPHFNCLSSILTRRQAELLGFGELNEINGNEINHEQAMTCPSDDIKLAGSPDVHEEVISGHEPAAPHGLHANVVMRDNGHEGERSRQVRKTSANAPRSARHNEIVVSYFHNDPAKGPTANLEIGGEVFRLVFATADAAEDKLRDIASKEWQICFEENVGRSVRQRSQAATKAGLVQQYCVSPLYDEKDKFGLKEPVADCVAVLWADSDGPPEGLMLVTGHKVNFINLERFSNGEHHRPLFKGRAAINDGGYQLAA